MKKVLIAIDYNPFAQKVAETGVLYARAMHAEICVVHVIADIAFTSMEYSPIMGFEGFSSDNAYKEMEEQEKEAHRFLEAVVKHLGDSSIQTKVLDGNTSNAILEYAAVYEADLIVMGTQYHHGLEKLITGDIVGKVINHAAIPILVVPGDQQDISRIARQQEAKAVLG
jgi:nucleotide-binding universal stress UspA family protein